MGRWALVMSVGAISAACSFGSAGAGQGPEVGETDEGGSDTTAAMTTSGSPSTGGGGSGSGATLDPDSSGGETTDDPSTADPTQAGTPRADLVFVEGDALPLGQHPLGSSDIITVELTNVGEAAASILGGEDPPTPLLWAGGEFPGTDATCANLLPPGGVCTVTLAVGPGQPGFTTGPLEVRFADDIGAGMALGYVNLTTTGRGENLLVNPDAELDPGGTSPTGWDTAGSTFRSSGEHNHEEGGSYSFYAGGSSSPELSQDAQLSAWSTSIDTLGMDLYFEGWSRAESDFWNDDFHAMTVYFLDGDGQQLAARDRDDMTHDGWESTVFVEAIPLGTRRVRVRLTCDRNDALPGNDNCSAWFDDFYLALEYTP